MIYLCESWNNKKVNEKVSWLKHNELTCFYFDVLMFVVINTKSTQFWIKFFFNWTWTAAEHVNYVNKNLCFTFNLNFKNHSNLNFTVQFLLLCSWISLQLFISFSLHQITTLCCFETERFILQFIEKISEFSSQLIMSLSFYKYHSISSFHDDDNNNNDTIHLYSKKNSCLKLWCYFYFNFNQYQMKTHRFRFTSFKNIRIYFFIMFLMSRHICTTYQDY